MTHTHVGQHVGQHVGKYVVLDTIGSGGMGVVLRAHDPELDRAVAIKLVRPRALSAERAEAARARLLSEARALARISHPNVVSVYEVGLHEGNVFVAMELVEGVDLDAWLRRAQRSVPEIVATWIAVARGLAQVHAAGLVHRDVKPPNVLVGDDGAVKIGDFGVARSSFELPRPEQSASDLLAPGLDLDTTALTAEGRVVGTPAYMAPEQHMGGDVGPAADQYALAVALFEALWGVRPFHVDARRLLAAKRGGARIPERGRAVPRWLVAVVLRGLAFDPEDRFASMDELARTLARGPSRSRTSRIALGGAALTAVGATALAVRLAAEPGLCEHDAEALAGAWDPSVRTAIAHAFGTSARPWAAASLGHVDAWLEGYAAEWRAMHRDACIANHVTGTQSDALLDRRMACLDARRVGLAATTELLASGDESAIDHAFELLAKLRPLAPCGDPAALEAALEPLDDPSLAAPVEAARTELARARVLFDAGRHPEALELAQPALAEAYRLEYPPLLVEALALTGRIRLRLGPLDEARGLLEPALWTAIGIGHDETAVDAATDLAWLAGQYDRSLPDAVRWAELARASLRRGAHADPFALVRIDNALGSAQLHAAHYDEAIATFEGALARVADDPGAVSVRASTRHNLAKSWFDRGDLARARSTLEPAIAELAATLGEEHPRVMAMRGTLAQVLGAAGEHARAVELFKAEVEGLRRTMGEDALAVAHARTNLGVSLGRAGRVDEAIAVTELALAAFERAGDDGGAATCLGNIADDLLAQGIHDAAATRFQRAVELLERMYPDGHPDLLYPLVGLGRVRMAQHRFADALASYERADALVAKLPGSSGHARGLALSGRAEALVALHRDRDALAVLAEQVEVVRTAGDAMPDELPLALLQRADQLHRVGRFAEARRDAEEARALAQTHGIDELRVAAEAELERLTD